MTSGASWPLVGRNEELELLDTTVESGGSCVVAGPAGVGKSRLTAEFLAQREVAGLPTTLVRATRSMATIPFGAFARWTAEPDGRGSIDRLHLLRSTCASLVGEHSHIVVAIDDAHLLDDGSAAIASHLAADARVSIVATVRSGESCPDAVAALWKDGLAERVDLQALSESETAELLERTLGAPLDHAARARVWALTEGVPLYVREVAHAAISQNVLVQVDGRWRWEGALAGSERLNELISGHMDQLDADERRYVELLALSEPLSLQMTDELGLRGPLERTESYAVVTLDDGSVENPRAAGIRLCHPLYGEVLRAAIPPMRARSHRSHLVRAARATGLHEREPLVVAEWALASDLTLDPTDAVLAARRALEMSDWGLAEQLSDAAATGGASAQSTLVRAVAISPQRKWDEATGLLAALALASLDDDTCHDVAGEAARIHSWIHFWGPEGSPSADDALAATGRLPAAIRPLALAHCALQAVLVARPDDATRLATAVLGDDALERPELDDVEVQALAALALAHGVQGRGDRAVAAAERALPQVAAILADDPVPGNPAGAMPTAYCLGLVLEGRIEEASVVARFIHEGPTEARALRALAGALRARMELYAGRLDAARQFADEALSICRETGQLPASHWPAATFASACAQAGEPEPGDGALTWALEASPIGPLYEFEARLARGWLSAARGEMSAARAEAVATAEAATAAGMHAFALFALLDVARFGASRDVVEPLGEVRVRGAYADAVIAYVEALAGDDAAGLHDSSERFEAMGALLLAAEAAANEMVVQRARGHRASESAAGGRARVLAARCGSPATPALRELTSTPAVALLTDREREVVELAARGLTNREIAERLFVSVRTVNTHLYRSYAKLGVNDREQLAPLVLVDEGGVSPK